MVSVSSEELDFNFIEKDVAKKPIIENCGEELNALLQVSAVRSLI